LLKLAATKKSTGQESSKERWQKETDFFRKLFMACDSHGTGSLDLSQVAKMARGHLKIAERLVSDDELKEVFLEISQGAGAVGFSELLSFVRVREINPRLNEIVLTQVKRAVRLAIQRQRLTLPQLEERFHRSAAEGIIDNAGGDGSLGSEEMRRFFRKILDVSHHEAPDRNLMIAFRAMDEDGGGTLDAEEFMDFIREAVREETSLCPAGPEPVHGEPRVATLLSGMRGVLPRRLPNRRPGTTYDRGRSALPFASHGRELPSRMRICASAPALAATAPSRSRTHRRLSSNLQACGLPKTAVAPPPRMRAPPMAAPCSPEVDKRSDDARFVEPGAPKLGKPCYIRVRGMLSAKDADALNRIEQRLFDAGVDVRGTYHKQSRAQPGVVAGR